MSELTYLHALWRYGAARLEAARHDESGSHGIEVAIATAILAGAALTLVGIIASKATGVAESIPTE